MTPPCCTKIASIIANWFSGIPWVKAGQIAPLATALIAICALLVAIYSVRAQRSVARKRASVDVFLKTEMDDKLLEAHKKYKLATEGMRNATSLDTFYGTDEYAHIRSYLNIHELIAVGIHNGVLDDDVCFNYWADELFKACADNMKLIEHARSKPGGKHTYSDLLKLHAHWKKKDSKL